MGFPTPEAMGRTPAAVGPLDRVAIGPPAATGGEHREPKTLAPPACGSKPCGWMHQRC